MEDTTNGYSFPTVSYDIPLIFFNCSEYSFPGDNKYAGCDLAAGADPCGHLKYLHMAKKFRKYFFAIIPLIFSIAALIINGIFAWICILILKNNNKKAGQRYSFLFSRSISTIIAQIMFYIVLAIWQGSELDYYTTAILLVLGSLSYLTLAGTNLGLSTIVYIAVSRPEWYEDNITMKRCVFSNIGIWIFTTAFSIFVGIYGATLFYPETSPIKCAYGSCQQPLVITLVILTFLCYFTVLAVYIIALIKMKLSHKKLGKLVYQGSIRSNIIIMNRMSYNLTVFAIAKLPLLVVCIVALINLHSLKNLGNGQKSSCKTFLNGKLYFEAEILACIAGFIWLIGMMIDPIINIINDRVIIKKRLKFLIDKSPSLPCVQLTGFTTFTKHNSNESQ